MPHRFRRLARLGAGSAAVLVLLVACGAGWTPASPAAPGGTAPIATAPGPTDVPTTVATPPPFACGQAVRRPGSVGLAHIRGLEAGNEGGIGRIIITFEPAGNVAAVPDVEIRPADPPFTHDPSGLPLAVPGTAHVAITLVGGTALDERFEPTFAGPFDLDPAGGPLVALRRSGDFEAVSSFVAGLDGAPCVRVLPFDGTSRLVIELTAE